MATRSAIRAGWLTGGVMLMIPDATRMRSVRARMWGITISLAEMWEYSARKWCSVTHTYFQFERSPASAIRVSSMRRSCSAASSRPSR